MSLLVTGTVALDTVTTPFGSLVEGLGGSATHFSVSASYFTDVHLIAVVGEDFPDKHIEFLKSKNIDVQGLQKIPGRTFRWTGKYENDLNTAHTLKTELNVLEVFKPVVPDSLKKPDFLFLANLDPDLQLSVINQVERPKKIALDTMNFWIDCKKDSLLNVIKNVDILTVNEGEARLLSGQANLLKAARFIQNVGPKTLIIKQGEYGALLFHEDRIFSAPGLPLEDIKDPTGAGDSFAGGFMGYLSQTGKTDFATMKQAVIMGSVMASYNVEEFSCERLKNLTNEDILKRIRLFKQLSHFEEISK